MHHPANSRGTRVRHHRPRIVLGVARMDDERLAGFGGELDLRSECRALRVPR
jgi:hypothetical protein